MSKWFASQDCKIFVGQVRCRNFLNRSKMPNFSLLSFAVCSLHSSACFFSDRFANSTQATICFGNHQFDNYSSQNQHFVRFLKSFGRDISTVRDHLEHLGFVIDQLSTSCNSRARQVQEEVILLCEAAATRSQE